MLLLSTVLLLASFLTPCAYAEVVAYWGQAGSNSPDLLSACSSTSADVIVVSFLVSFSAPFTSITAADINISGKDIIATGQQINQCKSQHGKRILLSVGGATFSASSAPWGGKANAETSAQAFYDTFLHGCQNNPFGAGVVFDGIDLDVESVVPNMYDFASKLHQLAGTSAMHAAPQCVWPDANLGEILSSVPMNGVFIQFYNNDCGVWENGNFRGGVSAINSWAQSSPNSGVKLYIGTPASSTAIGSFLPQCYKSHDTLASISSWASGSLHNFAGFMVWDLGHSTAPGGLGMTLNIVGGAVEAISGTINDGQSSPVVSATAIASIATAVSNGALDAVNSIVNNLLPSAQPAISALVNSNNLGLGKVATGGSSVVSQSSTTTITQTATVLAPSATVPTNINVDTGANTNTNANAIANANIDPKAGTNGKGGCTAQDGTARSTPGKAWEQCGGQCWTGSSTCESGLTCTQITQWWSDCRRGAAQSKRELVQALPLTERAAASPSSSAGSAAVGKDDGDSAHVKSHWQRRRFLQHHAIAQRRASPAVVQHGGSA